MTKGDPQKGGCSEKATFKVGLSNVFTQRSVAAVSEWEWRELVFFIEEKGIPPSWHVEGSSEGGFWKGA